MRRVKHLSRAMLLAAGIGLALSACVVAEPPQRYAYAPAPAPQYSPEYNYAPGYAYGAPAYGYAPGYAYGGPVIGFGFFGGEGRHRR